MYNEHVGVHEAYILLWHGELLAAEAAKVVNERHHLASPEMGKAAHQFVILLERILHKQHVALANAHHKQHDTHKLAHKAHHGIVRLEAPRHVAEALTLHYHVDIFLGLVARRNIQVYIAHIRCLV